MNLTEISDVRSNIIDATIRLLETSGPSEIKARLVSAEAGRSTMALYKHFSGIPDLLQAVADEGFRRQAKVFGAVPHSDDAIANLHMFALACRRFAGGTPHLYDLMYGLSIHGRYNNLRSAGVETAPLPQISPAFEEVFAHLLRECTLLVESGRIHEQKPAHIALQFWSTVHGFVLLDLAGHLAGVDDPVSDILTTTCLNLVVGMGAAPDDVKASVAKATLLWKTDRERG
ncbi:MAG TPA: WHG domain-containing protein [Sphingobium sp.]